MTLPLAEKRILIIVGDIYEDLELWYPKLRLIEAGAEVVVAGPDAETIYAGKNGYPCRSDAALAEVDPSSFDGLVVPGGFMPDKLRRDELVLNIVRHFPRKPENSWQPFAMAGGFPSLLAYTEKSESLVA